MNPLKHSDKTARFLLDRIVPDIGEPKMHIEGPEFKITGHVKDNDLDLYLHLDPDRFGNMDTHLFIGFLFNVMNVRSSNVYTMRGKDDAKSKWIHITSKDCGYGPESEGKGEG